MKDEGKRQRTPASRTKRKPAEVGGCIDLFLYVTNQTSPCLTAFANLRRICDEYLKGRCRITVIDLEKNPELARAEGILAIPTLVRDLPGHGKMKVIGTLDDGFKVLSVLGLLARNGYGGAALPITGR